MNRPAPGYPAHLFCACVVLLGFGSASHAAAGDIYHLGTLGGSSSSGYGISAGGQVVGYSDLPGDLTFSHAFRYTGTPSSGGVMMDLGTLGGTSSSGLGINASGQVAGHSNTTDDAAQHAFRYTGTPGGGGTMVDLGTLGGSSSHGHAINSSGQVAGDSFITGDNFRHPFRYTGTPGSGGTMVDLGSLGSDPIFTDSYASAINDAGQVAGTSRTSKAFFAPQHAFLYTGTPGAGGTMADLGTLAGPSGPYSTALAINNAAQVAGASLTRDGASHAFLYTGTPGSGGTMLDLGTLGGTASEGTAINAAGQVAGWSYIAGDNFQHAFLYTGTPGVDGRMIDLDAWLDANNPIEGAKWTLTTPGGITDTGLISGFGDYSERGVYYNRAFVLDASALVPEPASGGMAILSLTWLLTRRRSTRHR